MKKQYIHINTNDLNKKQKILVNNIIIKNNMMKIKNIDKEIDKSNKIIIKNPALKIINTKKYHIINGRLHVNENPNLQLNTYYDYENLNCYVEINNIKYKIKIIDENNFIINDYLPELNKELSIKFLHFGGINYETIFNKELNIHSIENNTINIKINENGEYEFNNNFYMKIINKNYKLYDYEILLNQYFNNITEIKLINFNFNNQINEPIYMCINNFNVIYDNKKSFFNKIINNNILCDVSHIQKITSLNKFSIQLFNSNYKPFTNAPHHTFVLEIR